MNKSNETRWYVEGMNLLSNSERRQIQEHHDSILNGGACQSPPHIRLFPRRKK